MKLSQVVLADVAHWGHDVNLPDAVAGLRANGLPDSDFIESNVVASDDHVELVHMFVTADRIGTGRGRRL